MTQNHAFAPGDALTGTEILYVDDDPQRRDSMRKVLASYAPRRIQMAESGTEALKVVMGTPCGLVVCEHRMKPMDGIQFVHELRKASHYPRAVIPVVLLGDPVGTDAIKAALSAGANTFLIRPVSPAKLYERLQWALSDTRPLVIKDGHYVIKPAKMMLPAGATRSDMAAGRKAAG